MIRWIPLGSIAVGLLACAGDNARQEGYGVTLLADDPVQVEEASFFAFDDRSIPFTRNLRLKMQRPTKYSANPILKRGEKGSPDELGVQFNGSVLRHEGKFKMWYVAVDERGLQSSAVSKGSTPASWRPAYAESQDGILGQTQPGIGGVSGKLRKPPRS